MAKKLVVVAEVTCDGSATALTAKSIGMERIEACHAQIIDDTTQAVIGTYEGTSITIDGTNTKKHLLFCYGY
jgi:hypothetical protein